MAKQHGHPFLDLPPAIQGTAPRLDTLNEVELTIRRATARGEAPLPLAEIGRRLRKPVSPRTVRGCVDYLKRWDAVREETGRGVWWTWGPP